MFRFNLVTVGGDDLGTVAVGVPDWPEGSILHRGDKPNLRVVRVVVPDDDAHLSVLVVEEV